MKIVQYKQHSVVLEEAGVLFEHDFDKHTSTYFTDNNEATCLLNSLTAEKVEDFFGRDNFQKLGLYENLYEVSTEGGLIYLYDPTGKLLFLRKQNDLACSEISSHSKIYSIFTEKLQQMLSNVTVSIHFETYKPSEEDFDEYF